MLNSFYPNYLKWLAKFPAIHIITEGDIYSELLKVGVAEEDFDMTLKLKWIHIPGALNISALQNFLI